MPRWPIHKNVTPGYVDLDRGANYTEEELAFLKAMERYKRENNRPFPTCCEVLKVLKSLGYKLPRKRK